MANKFYAVRQGRNPGIYRTWKDCQAQVSGFPCAQFKSFPALTEAEAFLNSSAGQDMEIDGQTLTAYVDGSYDHRKKEFSYGILLWMFTIGALAVAFHENELNMNMVDYFMVLFRFAGEQQKYEYFFYDTLDDMEEKHGHRKQSK